MNADSDAGTITAAALDCETTTSHTLAVQASHGNGGTDTALVAVETTADRVPGDAQIIGNPPYGTARPFHLVDLFPLSHLQQSVSTSTKTS